MESSLLETGLKLLDNPSKALIVAGAVLSWFAIKKNNQLIDKTFSIYEANKQDLKEINKELKSSIESVKNEFFLLKSDLKTLQIEINHEVETLTKFVHDHHVLYDQDFKKYFQELSKLKQLESNLEVIHGKVIWLDSEKELSNNKLKEVHDELSKFKTVLSFHNSQIKKHLK